MSAHHFLTIVERAEFEIKFCWHIRTKINTKLVPILPTDICSLLLQNNQCD